MTAATDGVRVRGVALDAILAVLPPARHDLAFRVYVAMRRRKSSRGLAADLAARAVAVFDAGADFATITAEPRVPTNWLTSRAPDDAPESATARAARAVRAGPAPLTTNRRTRSALR
jgi:hypothetical protein